MPRSFLAAALVSALSLVTTTASAITELRYATAAPENTPWGAYLKKTVAAAEKAAEGELKINIYFSSQLGDEQTVLRQTVRGRIDISGQSNTATSLVVPEIAVLSAPYLFKDAQQSDCVFDNHVQDIFGPMLDDKGLVLISYVEVGYNTLFSHEPILRPKDAVGVKMRLPPTLAATSYWKRAGGSGVPMGVVDMVPALKTGQVKALQTSTVYGIAIGLHKLAPNVTYAQISHDIGTITVSKKTWKKLNEKQRGALRLMANYVDELRKGVRGAEQALLGKIEKAGINVICPAGEDAASWRSYAAAAQQDLVEGIGPTAKPIWDKVVAAKKACGGA